MSEKINFPTRIWRYMTAKTVSRGGYVIGLFVSGFVASIATVHHV